MPDGNIRNLFLALSLPLLLVLSGCRTPAATLELIAIGQQGLASARQAETEYLQDRQEEYRRQIEALDNAFDADVRLVASGALKDDNDQSVELSPQWVMSARKGYSAARGLIEDQHRLTRDTHRVRMDNLDAAAEALDLAGMLIVQQWSVSEQIKQTYLKLTKETAPWQRQP